MSDAANVRILAPVILGVAVLIGVGVWALSPVRLLPVAVGATFGVGFLGGSIFLLFSAARELRRAKTAFDARKPTTALVVTGVYAATRNPVYLSMTLGYVGLALFLNSPWTLLISAPLGSALCLFAIRPEERYLETKFPEAYRAYRARTPRWI